MTLITLDSHSCLTNNRLWLASCKLMYSTRLTIFYLWKSHIFSFILCQIYKRIEVSISINRSHLFCHGPNFTSTWILVLFVHDKNWFHIYTWIPKTWKYLSITKFLAIHNIDMIVHSYISSRSQDEQIPFS
jgi:hypothetical protein